MVKVIGMFVASPEKFGEKERKKGKNKQTNKQKTATFFSKISCIQSVHCILNKIYQNLQMKQ